jgi:hypothetical protein
MKLTATLALIAIFGATTLPFTASAQSRNSGNKSTDQYRSDSKNALGQRGDSRFNQNQHRDSDRNGSRSNQNQRWNNDRRDDRSHQDHRWDNDRDRRDNDRSRWDSDRNRWDNDRDWRNDNDRRQQTKNEWRNIAIGAGALGILGLLQGDNTLFFGGMAGSLYSLNRYEQDRKSQNKFDRTRSEYFSRDHFYREGKRYDRRVVTKNGQRYYQFYRG